MASKDSGLSPLTPQRILFPPIEREPGWCRGRGKDGATELFEDILSRGSSLRIRVTGQSMFPFLKDGDVVTIRKASSPSLRVGDLLFFKNHQGLPVLHRLVRKRRLVNGSTVLQTKGDRLVSMDEPIPEGRVLGRVLSIQRKNGSQNAKPADMTSHFWMTTNCIIAVTSPVCSLICRLLNSPWSRGTLSSLRATNDQ